MNIHSKQSLQNIREQNNEEQYYLPKSLFDRKNYGLVRLETKMAYVAVLDVLLKKPLFDKEGKAFVKMDNPEIVNTLHELTNKKVDLEKMQKYYGELVEAELVKIQKQDIYVMEVE